MWPLAYHIYPGFLGCCILMIQPPNSCKPELWMWFSGHGPSGGIENADAVPCIVWMVLGIILVGLFRKDLKHCYSSFRRISTWYKKWTNAPTVFNINEIDMGNVNLQIIFILDFWVAAIWWLDPQIFVNLTYGWDALDMDIRWKGVEAAVISCVVHWSLWNELFLYLGPAQYYATL